MLCYRDMTWCPFYADCRECERCNRALTDSIRRKAARAELNLCQFVEKPGCWTEQGEATDGQRDEK